MRPVVKQRTDEEEVDVISEDTDYKKYKNEDDVLLWTVP